jgi:nucleoside-diphosphate kinase
MEQINQQFNESTLCLIKPDAVRRGLVGEVLSRLERLGLRLVAAKLLIPSVDLAGRHYTYEDIAVRHGEAVRNALISFITGGPVLAFIVEGISAIENVRKICGHTEPLKALPGTIRGDYSHQTFAATKAKGAAIRNLIHASANAEDAAREIPLWFNHDEIIDYRRSDYAEHFVDF